MNNKTSWFRAIFIISVLVISSLVFSKVGGFRPEISYAEQSQNELQADELTSNLITGAQSYEGNQINLAALVAIAQEREAFFAGLMATEPLAVINSALSKSEYDSMPAEIQQYLEKMVSIDGTLKTIISDYQNGTDKLQYFVLTPDNQRLELHFAGTTPVALTGSQIILTGIELHSDVALSTEGTGSTNFAVATQAPLPNTLGNQTTLVVTVNFSNENLPASVTPAALNSVLFTSNTSVNKYYQENSFGQTTLSGVITPTPVTIAATSPTCDAQTIVAQATTAVEALGYQPTSYDHRVFVIPEFGPACGWWGVSTLGGGSASWSVINGLRGIPLGIFAHEIGHTFGLWHSGSLDCGAVVWSETGCTQSTYGDSFDVMGGSTVYQYNSHQKEQLGWLNDGISPPITTVTGSGTFTIGAYETQNQPTVSKALKIQRGTTGQYIYLEARKALGFDAGVPANVKNGVLVHLSQQVIGSNDIVLLDMTPSTKQETWTDPAQDAGQDWTDPASGIMISVLSSDTTSVTVNVAFPVTSGPGTFSDNFDRIDSTTLGNGWSQILGASSIASNHAVHKSNTPALAIVPTLAGPIQAVEAQMQRTSSTGATKLCIIERYQSPNNFYAFCENQGGSSIPHIYKVAAGVWTQLDTNTRPSGNSYEYRTLTAGIKFAALALKIDGNIYATAIDSTFDSGSAGFYINGSGSTLGEYIDNWSEALVNYIIL